VIETMFTRSPLSGVKRHGARCAHYKNEEQTIVVFADSRLCVGPMSEDWGCWSSEASFEQFLSLEN